MAVAPRCLRVRVAMGAQLVKAQVMLLENNCSGCGRLLTKQLDCCTRTLSGSHPLAAKMLAVMARLRLKQGNEVECEQLQQQVLSMRRAALGLHHEDTHRSAMDVYSRRRQYVMRESNDMNGYMEMASAMEVRGVWRATHRPLSLPAPPPPPTPCPRWLRLSFSRTHSRLPPPRPPCLVRAACHRTMTAHRSARPPPSVALIRD